MPTSHVPSNPCSSCGAPVASRKPSASGKHWCSRPNCRAAKQRHYYSTRASRQAARAAEELVFSLVVALISAISQEHWLTDGCPECGRPDALDGWVHPTPNWTGVCFETGSTGNIPEMEPYFKALWAADLPEHMK